MDNKQNEIKKMLAENVFERVTDFVEKLFELGEISMDCIANIYDIGTKDCKYITAWYRVSPWFALVLDIEGAPVLYYDGFAYWGLAGSGIRQEERWEIIQIYEKHYAKT